jgi:hypothetical protein
MVKLKAGDALSANDEKRIDSLVEELSLTNQIAGQIKEQAESFGQETDAQKLSTELKSEALSLLQSSTGAVGDMVAAFAKGGGLIFLLQKAVSFISDMVTTYSELNREFGASVSDTVDITANIYKARIESGLLGASFDDIKRVTLEIIRETGRLIPPETVAAAERIGKALGDQRAGNELARVQQILGMNDDALQSQINKTLERLKQEGNISKEFINQTAALEALSTDKFKLLDGDEKTVDTLITQGLILKNHGFQIKELNRIRKGGLDVEQALRNEVELQLLTGKDINTNLLNQGILQQDIAMIAEGQNQILNQIGDTQLKNIAQQPALFAELAETLKVSEDGLTNLLLTRRELQDEQSGIDKLTAEKSMLEGQLTSAKERSGMGMFTKFLSLFARTSRVGTSKPRDEQALTEALAKNTAELANARAEKRDIVVSLNLNGRELKQIRTEFNLLDSITNSGTQ